MFKRLWAYICRRFAPTPAGVAVAAPALPASSGGLFSTDFAPVDLPQDQWAAYFHRLDARVFQRSLAPVDGNGKAIAAGVGMDAAADSFFNFANLKQVQQLGTYGVPDVLASWYASQGFIGYQMCAVLLQHWFIDKACTMPARDAIRKGYEIAATTGGDKTAAGIAPEVLDEMRALDKRFKIELECVEAVRMCRAYGIRVVIFVYEGVDYEKPFNPDSIRPGSYRGISQVDPYWITPEIGIDSMDPANPNFYEPTFWRVSGRRYHRSHLVVLRTCEVPDVLKPTYFFGGVPLPQRLYERVYAAERTANEAPQLAMSKRLLVMNVDMSAIAGKQGGAQRALENFQYYRDNYGVKLIGMAEKAQQFDTALNDLDETIGSQYHLCCAIAGVPITKMLGVQPKGFNSTGEYEEASYHEELASIQAHDMLPIIERHHLLVKLAFICPKFKIDLFKTSVEFSELDEETAKEAAERRKVEADIAYQYAQVGAVDGIDVRDKLRADTESGWNSLSATPPEGPRPADVVDPGAEKTAPNAPTPGEQQPAAAAA